MDRLSSKDKAQMRKHAQRLKPSVRIGRNGITSRSLEELEQAFHSQELVKVAFSGDRETVARLSVELEEASQSVCVGGVGKRRSYFKAKKGLAGDPIATV